MKYPYGGDPNYTPADPEMDIRIINTECSFYLYRGPWTIALSVQFAFRPTQVGMSFFSVVRKLNTYLKATNIGLKSFIIDNSFFL